MDLVKKSNRELNQTFITTSHEVLVAKECAKTYTLRDGKIIDIYKPSEIGRIFSITS